MDMMNPEHQHKRPLEYDQGMAANKRVRTSDEAVEIGILFQNQDLGGVIGKGGENIKNIRQESGAAVHTSKFVPGITERTAKVVGTVEEVSTAIKMIIDAVSKDNPMITLLAEYANCGHLIGKQGVTIKQIRAETQANIHVSKECIGNSSQKKIRIAGDYDAVSKGIDAVVMHLAEGKNPTHVAYVPGGVGGFSNPAAAGFSNIAAPGRGWPVPQNRGFPIIASERGGGRFQQSHFGGGGHQGLFNIGGRSQVFGGSVRPQGMSQAMGGFQNQREVVNRGLVGVATSAIRMEMTLWVPKELIGKIIGRAGQTIKAVRQQSTAYVYVHKGNVQY